MAVEQSVFEQPHRQSETLRRDFGLSVLVVHSLSQLGAGGWWGERCVCTRRSHV